MVTFNINFRLTTNHNIMTCDVDTSAITVDHETVNTFSLRQSLIALRSDSGSACGE